MVRGPLPIGLVGVFQHAVNSVCQMIEELHRLSLEKVITSHHSASSNWKVKGDSAQQMEASVGYGFIGDPPSGWS